MSVQVGQDVTISNQSRLNHTIQTEYNQVKCTECSEVQVEEFILNNTLSTEIITEGRMDSVDG